MSKSRGRNKTLASFTPTPYQDEFLRGDKRYLGFVSGVGAGKTYAGIIRTFLNMERWNPGEMGAIVAPTRQMVVNVIIPELESLGLLDKWEHKSSYSDEPGIHSPNGSRALILSADNQKTIERLRGLNLAWGWIDERTAVPKRAQEILSQRLRTGEYRNLYVTTTPKGKDDTYNFFVGDVEAEKSSFGEATLFETDDRLAIVGVPTRANPNTPEDYKRAMEMDMPEEIRAQEVEGQFIEIGSGILTLDMLSYADPEEIEFERLKYVVGVDVGVTEDVTKARENDADYWAATLIGADPIRSEAYVLDSHRKRGMSLKEGLSWLRGICQSIPNPEVCIESNQSQRWLSQEARDVGLNVTQVHNTDSKEHRLIQLSIPFENGQIRLVETGDDRFSDLKSEWLSFPEGSHDDVIDSLEIAVSNAAIGERYNILSGDIYNNE